MTRQQVRRQEFSRSLELVTAKYGPEPRRARRLIARAVAKRAIRSAGGWKEIAALDQKRQVLGELHAQV